MSLNMSKEEARGASDARLAEVKNSTRPDSAPHQYATEEIEFRHRKRVLRLGLWYSIATAIVGGIIWLGIRFIV
jgi:hypothetical protein